MLTANFEFVALRWYILPLFFAEMPEKCAWAIPEVLEYVAEPYSKDATNRGEKHRDMNISISRRVNHCCLGYYLGVVEASAVSPRTCHIVFRKMPLVVNRDYRFQSQDELVYFELTRH